MRRYSPIYLIILSIFCLFISACTKSEELPGLKRRINELVQKSAPQEKHDGIPPEGVGGDPLLNRQKNRDVSPMKIETYSIAQLLTIPSEKLRGTNDDTRKYWDADAKAYAEKWENKGVMVEGYITKARESGLESANGRKENLRDIHCWITADKRANKREGIIAEVTPRWKVKNPSWTVDNLSRLANRHARVRITGWLMWDEEHPDEVGKSRGTQWEIHPMTKLEVEKDGVWEELK